MKQNEFDFSVIDIQFEDKTIDKSNVGCFIGLDNQDIDCIIVDDVDHRLILQLEKSGSIMRVSVKGLVDGTKVGSVSFESEKFHDLAKKTTKEVWVSLFDHVDDDLYDGDFNENDSELPKIKISFTKGSVPTKRKKGAKKLKVTKVSAQKVEVQNTDVTTVSASGTTQFSVEALKSNLQSSLQELIEFLKTDSEGIQEENNERVAILANIEVLHEELKGEHAEDEKFTKYLEDLKNQIISNLGEKTQEIKEQVKECSKLKYSSEYLPLKIIENIEDITVALNKGEQEKKKAQEENDDLNAILNTPEDLTENGFTQEAKDLRSENEKNWDKSDKLTADFLKTRDERNGYIQSHKEQAQEFGETVQNFHDKIRMVAHSHKTFAIERDNILKETDHASMEEDISARKIELTDFDLASLEQTLNRLKSDYTDSDAEFNRYTDQLRANLKNQHFIINDILKNFSSAENQISDLVNENDRQKNQLNHYQDELTKIDQIGYEEKFTKLSGDLKNAEELRKTNQDELENSYKQLTVKLELFAEDLAGRRQERDEQIKGIEEALNNLQGVTASINELQQEIENMENKKLTDDNRDKVGINFDSEREAIQNKLNFFTDEKNKLTNELQEAISVLNEKNRRVQDQMKTIAALQKEISALKVLIEEKKKIIIQLEKDIQIADEEIERLKGLIADKEAEIARLNALLVELNIKIQELTDKLGDVPQSVMTYKAIKGDMVDELLAMYIQNCPVPVKRLGDGFYLFGTRKIYAKIMNGKLVIRVGGGYMTIEKFIDTYAEQELVKINSILEREGLSSVDEIDLEEYCLKKNRTSYGNKPGEKSPSNNSNMSGSFRKGLNSSNSKMNGSNRSPKTVHASQVVSHKK